MSPDWGLHGVTARGVVGTCTISQGSANGLALAAKVQRWPYATIRNSSPLHLTLIPDELEMRFPCRGQLMLALLWTLSPGMIKGNMLGNWVKLKCTAAVPFILNYYLIKA